MSNIISLHPASFGRRRDLASPPYEPLPVAFAFEGVAAERLPCGWPVLPADIQIVQHDDGRLTVRPTPRAPAALPADAPSPIDWLPPRGFLARVGWAVRLARLLRRA